MVRLVDEERSHKKLMSRAADLSCVRAREGTRLWHSDQIGVVDYGRRHSFGSSCRRRSGAMYRAEEWQWPHQMHGPDVDRAQIGAAADALGSGV